MEVNELVATIVREVLKQLKDPRENSCVMVLAARKPELEKKIRAAIGDEAEILFFGEDTGKRTPVRYFLPSLCCGSMADLALGRTSDQLLTMVLRLLLGGTTIEVLEFGYKAYAETAPQALYELYVSYEKTLASYGLIAFQPKSPESVRLRGSLVTESDVHKASEQGAKTLLVPLAARITPLAAESAKKQNINIVKQL